MKRSRDTVPAQNKTHDALIADWQEKATDHDDEDYRFLRSLKMRSPKKVDRIALELHQEAFSIVDCTMCANCRRTLRVVVTDDDVPRIARYLNMTDKEFVAAYLKRDDEEAGIASRRRLALSLGTTISARFTTCDRRSVEDTLSRTSPILSP
jgi:hypothetical protein